MIRFVNENSKKKGSVSAQFLRDILKILVAGATTSGIENIGLRKVSAPASMLRAIKGTLSKLYFCNTDTSVQLTKIIPKTVFAVN